MSANDVMDLLSRDGSALPLEALVVVPGLGNPWEHGERNRKKGSGATNNAAVD
jgi:hypothetical protein